MNATGCPGPSGAAGLFSTPCLLPRLVRPGADTPRSRPHDSPTALDHRLPLGPGVPRRGQPGRGRRPGRVAVPLRTDRADWPDRADAEPPFRSPRPAGRRARRRSDHHPRRQPDRFRPRSGQPGPQPLVRHAGGQAVVRKPLAAAGGGAGDGAPPGPRSPVQRHGLRRLPLPGWPRRPAAGLRPQPAGPRRAHAAAPAGEAGQAEPADRRPGRARWRTRSGLRRPAQRPRGRHGARGPPGGRRRAGGHGHRHGPAPSPRPGRRSRPRPARSADPDLAPHPAHAGRPGPARSRPRRRAREPGGPGRPGRRRDLRPRAANPLGVGRRRRSRGAGATVPSRSAGSAGRPASPPSKPRWRRPSTRTWA